MLKWQLSSGNKIYDELLISHNSEYSDCESIDGSINLRSENSSEENCSECNEYSYKNEGTFASSQEQWEININNIFPTLIIFNFYFSPMK